jgi:hypothetical protein
LTFSQELYNATINKIQDETGAIVPSNRKTRKQKSELIIVPARQGHFFQPGKNSLSLKQLAGLTKTPLPGLHFIRG